MSVHQYIGARYVPYYYENSLDPTSTEWEPNVNYEALTVVTLPNQHSYISKKAVPDTVGSPALNAEYWLDTGSENGYIQDLQNQIDDINNITIPAINSDIDALEADVTALQTRKIALISDSYGAIAGSTLKTELETAFRMPIDMDAVSSMGFVRDVGGQTFIDLLDNFSADDLPLYDYLIVYGGMNDYVATDYSQEYNAVSAFITRAKTLFTKSKIVIFGPQSTPTGNIDANNKQAMLKRAIQNACVENGVGYADATNWLTLSPSDYSDNYLADRTHPSALGYKLIASRMLRYFVGDCGQEIMEKILILSHAGDALAYSVNGNVINFSIVTAARNYTQNTFDTFFTINSKYRPFIHLQAFTPHFYYGSNYFLGDVIGSFQVDGNNGGRFLAKDTMSNARIGVSGSIILFPNFAD